jgi:superoxide dismutase
MTTLQFNAFLVNLVGFTMIAIFIAAWAHATYTDFQWRRQEREYRRILALQEWSKIQASRNVFTVNTIR